MNELEIIRRIVEEDKDINVTKFLNYTEEYNLVHLCILNKKYLTDENIKHILKLNKTTVKGSISDNYPHITNLIANYPEIINKIPEKIINNFKSKNWKEILKNAPDLIDEYNIKLDLDDKIEVLQYQPQLVNRYKDFYCKLDAIALYRILLISDKILNYININNIINDYNNLIDIIIVNPNVIDLLNKDKIDKISDNDWLRIIQSNPKAMDKCPKKDNVIDLLNSNLNELVKLVAKEIKFKDMLPSADNIPTSNLKFLIKNQPELIEVLNINFKIFDEDDWAEILNEQPQLINRCDKIKYIRQYKWVDILKNQPSLIDYCDKLDKFSNDDIFKLLNTNFELINKLEKPIDDTIKNKLLLLNPNLITELGYDNIDKYVLETVLYNFKGHKNILIEKYIEKYKDPEILTNMIAIYPDLKELYTKKDLWKYVDFSKLNNNLEYSILK